MIREPRILSNDGVEQIAAYGAFPPYDGMIADLCHSIRADRKALNEARQLLRRAYDNLAFHLDEVDYAWKGEGPLE